MPEQTEAKPKRWFIRKTKLTNHYFYDLTYDDKGRVSGSTWGNKEFWTGIFMTESEEHARGWQYTLNLSHHDCEIVYEEVLG